MRHLDWLDKSLRTLRDENLDRPRRVTEGKDDGRVVVDGRRLVDFTSNDYLGLAGHPEVVAAAQRALDEQRLGSGASALVSGRTPTSARLEEALARFEGTEDAILFPTGYAANMGTIAALLGPRDIIFCDRLGHSCLVDGCRLSGAAFRVFRSDRLESLERHLARATGHARRWIVTEGVFGMDGTISPLGALCDLAERFDAAVIVDEAHASGVLGERGRGACEYCGVEERIAVRTGTLSKAVGALGGFVPGSRSLIEFLWNSARTQMFSTALPPVVCAAASEAVWQIENDPAPRRHVAEWAILLRRRLREAFRETDIDVLGEGPVPIVPIVLRESRRTLHAAEQLRARGFSVAAIRAPTVPRGTARLRISLSAAHSRATVTALAEALIEVLAR